MKNRLIVLASAMLSYGHMQAVNYLTNYRYWPQAREDIRNFSPYSSISSLKQSPSYAAQRIAAIERLYESADDNKWRPNQLYSLEKAYDDALSHELLKEYKKENTLDNNMYYLKQDINNLNNTKWYYDKMPLIGQYLWNRNENALELNNLLKNQEGLKLQKDFINNNMRCLRRARTEFETELKEERAKSGPLYEYFQNPSRNILGEY